MKNVSIIILLLFFISGCCYDIENRRYYSIQEIRSSIPITQWGQILSKTYRGDDVLGENLTCVYKSNVHRKIQLEPNVYILKSNKETDGYGTICDNDTIVYFEND